MEETKTISKNIESIQKQSSKTKPYRFQKYNPMFKKLNNNYYYINNIHDFQIKCNLKIFDSKYGGKSYLLKDIKFPFVFKDMYLSLVKKLYKNEDIDIMNKIDSTLEKKKILLFLQKLIIKN